MALKCRFDVGMNGILVNGREFVTKTNQVISGAEHSQTLSITGRP